MIILPKPLPEVEPEEIFETCIKSFRNKTHDKLSRCSEIVKTDSEEFERLTPEEIDQFHQTALPKNVSAKDMVKVYEQKFVPSDQAGRKYYDAIMAGTKRGICPICGVRTVHTLDHYLPKTEVPSLVVTPANLIPACRDCNMEKNADMVLDPMETPVHIYFDRVPDEPWLHVEIGQDLEVTYFAQCPNTWEPGIRSRIEKHLDYYKLHVLYSSQAAEEIADMEHLWQELLTDGGAQELLSHICKIRKSAEMNDRNSWKAALYRGLETQSDLLLTWLYTKMEQLPVGSL